MRHVRNYIFTLNSIGSLSYVKGSVSQTIGHDPLGRSLKQIVGDHHLRLCTDNS